MKVSLERQLAQKMMGKLLLKISTLEHTIFSSTKSGGSRKSENLLL